MVNICDILRGDESRREDFCRLKLQEENCYIIDSMSEEASSLRKEIEKMISQIRIKIREFIYESSEDKYSIGSSITVRDGSVYKYHKSRKASIKDILKVDKSYIMRRAQNEEKKKKVGAVLDYLSENDKVFTEGLNSIEYTSEKDDETLLYKPYTRGNNTSIKIMKEDSSSIKDRIRIAKIFESMEHAKLIVEHGDELKELFKKILEDRSRFKLLVRNIIIDLSEIIGNGCKTETPDIYKVRGDYYE